MNYIRRELMVAAAAREIHDGDKVFVGMRLPLLGFAVAKETHEMVLDSYHPGVSVEQITDETGWPVQISSEIHETTAPRRNELAAVRKYDPKGVWTS